MIRAPKSQETWDSQGSLAAALTELVAVQGEMLRELRAIREALAAGQVRSADPDSEMLMAIRAHVDEGEVFTSSELGAVLGIDARQLGRMLARLEGTGLRRVGRWSGGMLWTREC